MGVIQSDDFIQKEYPLEELEEAILEHAAQKVIKNCIVYQRVKDGDHVYSIKLRYSSLRHWKDPGKEHLLS